MPVKTITVTWVNNPSIAKSGKPYYNIKYGNPSDPPDKWEVIWGKAGKLDGISTGDIIEVVTSIGKTGGENLVTWTPKTNGAGEVLKSHRQTDSPDVVDGKCITLFVEAFIAAGAVPLSSDAIAGAIRIASDGYFKGKHWMSSTPIQTTREARGSLREEMDDEIPYD